MFPRGGEDSSDLLCGRVGAGKTRLACTVLNESWWSMAFARVPLLLYRLRLQAVLDTSNSSNETVSFPSTSASRRACSHCARCHVGIPATFAGTSA